MSTELNDRLSNLTPQKRALLQRKLLEKRAQTPSQTIGCRQVISPCPLSYSQDLMWLLEQLTPGLTTYHVPRILRLQGNLNVDALQQALNEIFARHEILRTTYRSENGVPMQVITPQATIELTIVDLQKVPEQERKQESERVIHELTLHPFDLTRDFQLASTLVKLSPNEHVLVSLFHHIGSDGWSAGVFLQELQTLYTAFCEGRPSPLPPLPIQYADFAVWQREWLQGKVLEDLLGYWKKELAGYPEFMELPTDHPRPDRQSGLGRRFTRMLSKEVSEAVKQLGRQEKTTQFMTLLAAFQALMHRYTGYQRVVVGTPISGRIRTELEGLIGFFSNSLVMPVDCSGNPTFRELLRRVKEVCLGAFSHQEMPFEKLVVEMKPARTLRYTPLYQVMFAVGNARPEEITLPGLRITPINHDRGTAKFDLSFGLRELPQGFRAGIEYSADLFEEPTIERMVRHYEILLQQIIANPDQRIGCIPILTEAERRLYALHSPLPEPEPLPDITERFAVQAAATPDRIAVADGKQRLTYCQLDQRSNQLAHLLKGLGVGPEVCVGIYVERSVEMVVATMAVLKAGGAFVPLDLNNPPERFRTIVEIAKPTVLVTQEILAANIDCEGLKVVRLDTDYALIAQEPVQGLPLSASGENLAYVLFTSGSTGVPKGVMIERRMLSNTYRDYEEVYRLRSLSSHVQMANIAFDVYVGDFIRALCSGGKLVISPYDWVLDPPRLYALMRSEQADAAEFVPVVLRELIKYVEETGQSLDFMKLLVNSSDTWYVEEWRRFQKFIGPDTHLLNSYGATECTIDSTYYDNREIDRPSEQPVPAGKALPHSRMYILNDNMQLQPIGVAGEIYLGGESPARGYLNRPDFTAERFVPDPFSTSANAWMYRTGDSGRMAADGNVDFIGRLDYQVKIRGLRIELGEIEAVLMQHPAVAAGVVAKRTEHGGERLVGYVVWRPDQKTTFEALRSYLKSKLPTHFVPNVFVEMPELPLLPNGKIDRKTLPAPDLQAICPDGLYEAPQSTMEATMAEIWGQELGIERVGALDNFFDLGGHSLMLMKVIAQAENKLGVRLPPANFYTQTLRQIAARYEELLRQNSAAESSSRADESATVLQKAFRSFRSILGRK